VLDASPGTHCSILCTKAQCIEHCADVCALALGSMVFEYVINQPYALAVQVNGETVGYVANEDVFDTAREDVMERINYAREPRRVPDGW